MYLEIVRGRGVGADSGSRILVEHSSLRGDPLFSSGCCKSSKAGVSILERNSTSVGGSKINSVKSFNDKNMKKHDGESTQVTQGFGGLLDSVLFQHDEDLSSTLEDVVVGVDEPEIISAESLNDDAKEIPIIDLSCETEKTQNIDQSEIHSDSNDLNENKKEYKCNVCGKLFRFNCRLTEHEKTHTGKKPYPCKICGKMFATNSGRKQHSVVHTGEKPFRCNYCDNSYSCRRSLINHERTHTGEKPFQCNYCDEKFSTKPNLKGHERTHTGEGYVCNYCDEIFAHRNKAIMHENVYHKGISFVCNKCGASYGYETSLKRHKKKKSH